MNELSLFSGSGGGILGSKLLGWNTIGYVEWDDYCQQVIAQRIKDGIFDNAPIYGDIRAFIDSGRCELYRGITDIVSAGFPCQAFSVAGKGEAENDERNKWPETIEVISKVRPRYALLENVPGLFNHEYIRRIFGDLAESGYDCRWRIVSAADVGAPHLRKRVWILATDTESKRLGEAGESSRRPKERIAGVCSEQTNPTNTNSQRRHGIGTQAIQGQSRLPWGENLRSVEDIKRRSDIPEPLVCRMDDGMAYRTQRLRAVGNGQVPFTMATAWKILSEGVV